QAVHVLDGCLAARVFLLDGIIDFRFASFIAFKNGLSEFALVLSHSSPSAVKGVPTFMCGEIQKKRYEMLKVAYKQPIHVMKFALRIYDCAMQQERNTRSRRATVLPFHLQPVTRRHDH